MRWLWSSVLLLAGSGCAPPSSTPGSETGTPRVGGALISPELWVQSDDDGPFSGHRPPQVDCPNPAATVEAGAFEILTDECNYLAASQPSLLDVQSGDTLVIDWAHGDLVSPQPAIAHLGFGLGSEIVFETTMVLQPPPEAIAAAAMRSEVVVEFDAPQGTPVYMHVHNHGANSWRIFALDLKPE